MWPSGAEGRDCLAAFAAALAGDVLRDVSFLGPATTPDLKPRMFATHDDVDDGVELHFASVSLRVQWAMHGNLYTLVGTDSAGASVDDEDLHRHQVSPTSRWTGILASRVTGTQLWWETDGELRAVIAVDFRFERHRAVIALGRTDASGRVEFQPDNLVVIFDSSLADAYLAGLAAVPTA